MHIFAYEIIVLCGMERERDSSIIGEITIGASSVTGIQYAHMKDSGAIPDT